MSIPKSTDFRSSTTKLNKFKTLPQLNSLALRSLDYDFSKEYISKEDYDKQFELLRDYLNDMRCSGSLMIAKTERLQGQLEGELMMINKVQVWLKKHSEES